MPRTNKSSPVWLEALKFITRCPLCNEVYALENARLFGANERASLVHIVCAGCSGFFVLMVVLLRQGMSSVGMVTDLSFEDARRLHKLEPLTIDDTINYAGELSNLSVQLASPTAVV